MSELKINNVSVLTESGGEVTGTLKTLKMGATTVFTESGGTVTAQNMGFSANDAGVKTALNASGNAPIYACRAWVNFDGTNAFSPNPSTSAIRNSGNVSSIYDNGTGNYTVNFTTAMSDVNYTAVGNHNQPSSGSASVVFGKDSPSYYSTTQLQLTCFIGSGVFRTDASRVTVAVFN